MDAKRALQWSGYYFVLSTVFAAVGLVFVGAGAVVGVEPAIDAYRADASTTAVLRTGALGLVLVLFGLGVWRLGKAWAFYRTLTAAVEEELSETFDTEHVKSDILSVLDDRLADMQRDVKGVHSDVAAVRESLGEPAEADYEFDD